MKRKALYVLFYVAMVLALSGAAMVLWNALLPSAFHLPTLNYWQALGLVVLGRILFGRLNFPEFGSRRNVKEGQHLLKDKLMTMNEDDRATFKEEWRKRCRPNKK